jgi:hypothetical protein
MELCAGFAACQIYLHVGRPINHAHKKTLRDTQGFRCSLRVSGGDLLRLVRLPDPFHGFQHGLPLDAAFNVGGTF